MNKYLLLILCLFATSSIFAQYTDSSNETIFELDKAKTTQITFTGKEIALGVNYQTKLRVFTVEDEESAVKADVIGFELGLVNSSSNLDLDDFDLKKFGLKAGLSYKWTIKDTIVDMDRKATTGSISLKYQMDRFDLYDPVKQKISDETPSELSLRGNITRYYNSYKAAFALTGTYNVLTYNKTGLENNFKKNSGITQDANVTSFKSFDGKYGTLDDNLNGARLALSFPFFFQNKIFSWDKMPYFSPIPYVSTTFTKDLKPTQNIGFSFNFLEKKPFANNVFSLPSSLGLGIDWTQSNDSWSKANIFLSGTITFK